jgi:hypothetical protein
VPVRRSAPLVCLPVMPPRLPRPLRRARMVRMPAVPQAQLPIARRDGLEKMPVAKEASAEVVAAIAYAIRHHSQSFWNGVGGS